MKRSCPTLKRRPAIIIVLIIFGFVARGNDIFEGYRTFGSYDYDSALYYFNKALQEGSTWNWLPEIIATVEKRKNMGNIVPGAVHKVGVIFVTQRTVHMEDGSTGIYPDVSSIQKENWLVNFRMLARILETFSDGNWSLEFDTVSAHSEYINGDEAAPDNPDHLDLENYFFQNMYRFDSFITLSNTRSPARGLARTYPVVHDVLYGPHRGMAALNAGTHGFPTLLHEFFHIVEWVSNAIGHSHGFEESERHFFPEWTGETEFDYYRWHFSDTLSTIGWNKLNHSTRWIPFNWSEAEYLDILEAYEGTTRPDRLYARVLYDSAARMKTTDLETAVQLYRQALVLSPYHEMALSEIFEYYAYNRMEPDSAREYLERLDRIRAASDYYIIDDESKEYGQVFALYNRENITQLWWEHHEWDVSTYISESGTYDINFHKRFGDRDIRMDSLYLLADDEVVSYDLHEGYCNSNGQKVRTTYTVSLPNYEPGKKYKVKVRISGWFGNKTYGQVHLLKSGPAVFSSPAEARIPSLRVFPNPGSTSLRIEASSPVSSVRLFDQSGREHYTFKDFPQEIIELNASSFAPGFYLIRVVFNNKIETIPWVKH